MDAQLTAAAKTLARWCYERGVDERVFDAGEQILGRAVDQALGRRATPQLEHALWQHVAGLLRQRRQWDSAHQVTAPPAAECLWCAITRQDCPQHAPCRCRVCSGLMHRSILEEGFDTHPCCDRTVGPGTYADLEHITEVLGAKPLPQPA
jgi:hypothetical protein